MLKSTPWSEECPTSWCGATPSGECLRRQINRSGYVPAESSCNRVPITQSYKLFHALRDFGVTTQFVAYPIAGHNAADPVRQRDVQRRWMGWLEQYLNAPVAATQIKP